MEGKSLWQCGQKRLTSQLDHLLAEKQCMNHWRLQSWGSNSAGLWCGIYFYFNEQPKWFLIQRTITLRNSQNKSLNFWVYHHFSLWDLKPLENEDRLLFILVSPVKSQHTDWCVVSACSKNVCWRNIHVLSFRAEVRIKEATFVKFSESIVGPEKEETYQGHLEANWAQI